ncbi:MAG: hypothetical protein DRJ36_02245, partial [Thermoprotei archaeon]
MGRRSFKQTLTIRVNDEEELKKLIETLTKRLSSIDMYVVSRQNWVKIRFYGDLDEVRYAVRECKRIYKEIVASKIPDKYGFYKFSIPSLLSDAQLKVAIPVKLLGLLLEVRGYETRIENILLITKAPYEVVVRTAEELSKAYYESLKVPLTPTARRALTLYGIVNQKPLKEALRELIGRKILVKKGGVYHLTRNINEVLEEIV